MTLENPMNKIRLQGHQGPHGLYNTAVFHRLYGATFSHTPGTPEYRKALRIELAEIRKELRAGTDLGALVRERVQRNWPEQREDRLNSTIAASMLGL